MQHLTFAAFLVAGALFVTSSIAQKAASGAESFETRCGQCHTQGDPTSAAAAEWFAELNAKGSLADLTPEEQSDAVSFLQHHDRQVTEMVAMAEERRLFEKKCNLCHSADRVFLEPLTDESRRHIVLRMQGRAPDWISRDEADAILAYLDQGAPGATQPDEAVVEAQPAAVFRERCSGCHTLERVYLHLEQSGREGAAWVHIVNRMQSKAPDWITEDEAMKILGYLESLQPVLDDNRKSSQR